MVFWMRQVPNAYCCVDDFRLCQWEDIGGNRFFNAPFCSLPPSSPLRQVRLEWAYTAHELSDSGYRTIPAPPGSEPSLHIAWGGGGIPNMIAGSQIIMDQVLVPGNMAACGSRSYGSKSGQALIWRGPAAYTYFTLFLGGFWVNEWGRPGASFHVTITRFSLFEL